MSSNSNALKTFRPWKIYLAIFLGLGGTTFLFYNNLSKSNLTFGDLLYNISNPYWLWIIAAIIVLFIRDAGYMYRIKHLTNNHLSWNGSIFTILLWEFSSAITPSVVGGTAVAIFILNKEGISSGKSVAYVTLTAMLDNLFFIVAAPLALTLVSTEFMAQSKEIMGWTVTLGHIFWISYGLIALYTIFMAFGVLISPIVFQKIVLFIAKLFRFNKKWKNRAMRMTVDVITASQEIKGNNALYWVKAIVSTIFVWTSRYFLLNCLLAGFVVMDIHAHGDALGKQVILWITQLVSPTPGGAGLVLVFFQQTFAGSHEIFGNKSEEEINLLLNSIGFIWRIMTFYAYLALGSYILPKWIKRINSKNGVST